MERPNSYKKSSLKFRRIVYNQCILNQVKCDVISIFSIAQTGKFSGIFISERQQRGRGLRKKRGRGFGLRVVLLSLLCGAALAFPAYAGVVTRNRSAALAAGGVQGSREDGGALVPYATAAEATRSYGYSREDAVAAAEALYSFETNQLKKELDMSYLLSSIWYDPENLMQESDGSCMLRLYSGPVEQYQRAYLEALDGLSFFSAPTVYFYKDRKGELMVVVQTPEIFTEQRAAENYALLRQFLGTIEEVKTAVAEKDETDKAKYICDYVANHLRYDRSYERNSLGDAVRSGVTACVGYNEMTELLFEHCGIPYVSVVASSKQDANMMHIFGMARIGSSWLLFDTTNYDRDDGRKETYWIFSDIYREGAYYKDFRMVEELGGEKGERSAAK